MPHALVTGCAGFIGSALCRQLLSQGYQVTGIDCFTDNYETWMKDWNLKELLASAQFSFIRKNILDLDLFSLLSDVEYVFHQAALPGVRTSWGSTFEDYVKQNILATQALLEASKNHPIKKFVYASSSSVYGKTVGCTSESSCPGPISPYGVSKLAAEHLCTLYAKNFDMPTISLRYFTVYGPGQRPDMAFHRFIHALIADQPIPVYGDGSQLRDFTYVDDIVAANIQAIKTEEKGEVVNIGSDRPYVLLDVIGRIGRLVGKAPNLQFIGKQAGDPPSTWADLTKARKLLHYEPSVLLEDGLMAQIAQIQKRYTQRKE